MMTNFLNWTRSSSVLAVLVVLVLLPGPKSARAVEGSKELGIASFSMQTTKSVKVPGELTHENWGFENVPAPETQAGAHLTGAGGGPDALTAKIAFQTETLAGLEGPVQVPTRDPRDIAVSIPPGLLGNPTAVPRCSLKQALSSIPCPSSTQVGVAVSHYLEGEASVGPIVNVMPEAGQSAEFVIESKTRVNFVLTGHVVRRTEGGHEGYGLSVVSNGTPNVMLTSVETTFWGVPDGAVHTPERGLLCERLPKPASKWECGLSIPGFRNGEIFGLGGEPSNVGEDEAIPFLTLPSDCAAGAEHAAVKADSWEQPGVYAEKETTFPAATGCEALRFEPEVGVEPDTRLADAPVGLGVNLTVPQFELPRQLATPQINKGVITLPAGLSISPGVVDGIEACNEFGPEGINFTGPESEEIGVSGESQLAPGHCPNASTVGTAEAETPLLSVPIRGHVYLARPGCGGAGEAPCTEEDVRNGRLYQLYLELGGTGPLAATGVHVKVRLKTEVNPATGQLTSVADEIAQLPFSELRVRLNGGPRAPLDNAPACGPALTTTDFTSWSAPGFVSGLLVPGVPDASPSTFYEVNEGCADPPPLAPGFVAGTVTPNAGKFTAFTLDLGRKDREQYIKGIQVHTPPGLLGVLANVPLCPEAQADAGSCSESSKIGTTRVASGAGSHPFELDGDMYLTGPYDGAPFGLSIVVHVVAGPFNLGVRVVRARIMVDPEDSTLTITTDETGPYAVPQIVFGVPVRLQRVTVDVDRPNFMFNPTRCSAQRITASIAGTLNAVANVASPFAVGDCKSLLFKPRFSVTTSGHTSRARGASLDARLSYPRGAFGNDANIAKVKVSLPKQLPSRLSTLQQACPAALFARNAAGCPSGSIVGIARAHTPLLPVELTGPAYFVSHGGERFPSLVVVLEGDNVRVDLTGTTFISKAGITSSTFSTVPDVPVDTFELYLPEGKFSALAANTNLCAAAQGKTVLVKRRTKERVHGKTVTRTVTKHVKSGGLAMPTEFVAQNGATVRQTTHIGVSGCAKPKHNAKRGRTRK